MEYLKCIETSKRYNWQGREIQIIAGKYYTARELGPNSYEPWYAASGNAVTGFRWYLTSLTVLSKLEMCYCTMKGIKFEELPY